MTNSGRRHSTAVELGAALALALALGPACTRTDNSAVARGEYYAAGQPDYDEFFVRVYRYQTETQSALELEKKQQSELARALGAPANTSGAALAAKIKERSADASVEEPIRAAAVSFKQLNEATSNADAVERLRVKAIDLDRQVDKAFWRDSQSKRSEVRENLADAQKILVLIGDKRKALADSSGALLAACEQTLRTNSAVANAAPAEPNPAPKKPARKRAPARSAAQSKPAAAAPAAKSSPAPAAKPEPAAKPAPAPAKADFEP